MFERWTFTAMADRYAWLRPLAAGVAAALLSVVYTALLGFGVNERCTSTNNCASAGCAPCSRLVTYSWLHMVLQVVLAVGASVALWRMIDRSAVGDVLRSRTVIVVVWGVLAFAGLYAYTRLSWAWANRTG